VHGPKCTVPGSQPTQAHLTFSLACRLPRGCARPRRRAGDTAAATDETVDEGIRAAPVRPPCPPPSFSPAHLARSARLPPSDPESRALLVAARRHRRGYRRPRVRLKCQRAPPKTTASTGGPRWSRGSPRATDRAGPLRSDAGDPLRPPACTEPPPSRLLIGDHRCKLGSLPDISASPLFLPS
jgi:hypothetical protein